MRLAQDIRRRAAPPNLWMRLSLETGQDIWNDDPPFQTARVSWNLR